MLKGKKILITGGSSRLGSVFVRKALLEGADVFFTFHSRVDEAQKLIRLGAEGFQLDLVSAESIKSFAQKVGAAWSDLDVLIHNAAATRDNTVQHMTEKEWDEVIAADLRAPFLLSRILLPLLRKKKGSPDFQEKRKIFFITSRLAITGGAGAANYAAAKAGLIGLAKSMAKELGRRNILVNLVNPGFMRSRMTENLPPEVVQKHMDANPLGEYSNPAEVADFLIYLCSDRMRQVTGQIFHCEGRSI